MLAQPLLRILLTGIGIAGLTVAGCSQSGNLQAEAPSTAAQPTPESTTTQVSPTTQAPTRAPDVVYVPTPQSVVNEMLRVANVGSDDVIYDLGSGDGRIVITAAQKYGTRGVGIDIDPQRIQEANQNAQAANVTDQVEFRQDDLFETDFSEASVVTLYLLPELNVKLRPKLLRELKPGTRIVSHAFDMGEWQPEQVLEVDGRTVYYWVVPEDVPENLL